MGECERERGESRNKARRSIDDDIDDINHVEYLPAVNTIGLLQKVRAAIFLSLNELWSVPMDLVRIATVLDPRFKNFQWDKSGEEKDKSHELLREQYDFTKMDFEPKNVNIQQTTNIHNTNENNEDNFFEDIEIDLGSFEVEDDEISSYIKLRQIDILEDPLKWWDLNKNNFPILSQLAQKYLSIPATSVPSERLFSDAGNHISARRTQLSPDLVNQILFLKRNSEYFNMFSSRDS